MQGRSAPPPSQPRPHLDYNYIPISSDTWRLETAGCSSSYGCQLQYAEWRPVKGDHKVVCLLLL